MRRFLGYYRQFEELSPEEVSRELRERRDEEKAQALTETPALDLSSPAWHEPPHAEIVNAATFALRRAVNAYPDAGAEALAAALAARHGVEPAQVVAGHGAGELLRAALQALLAGARTDPARRGRDRVAGLGPAAAARARGRRAPGAGAARPRRRRRRRRAGGRGRGRPRARSRSARPTTRRAGRSTPAALRRLAAALPARRLDPARRGAGRLRGAEADLAALTGELERLLVVRSFSKAHAMAGFRAGYAVGPEGERELLGRLAPRSASPPRPRRG